MEPWFILCLLGYTISAVSSTLDKYMMNQMYHPVTTVLFRTLFNAMFLGTAGLILFHMTLSPLELALAFVPAVLLIISYAVYLRVLQRRNATEIQPFSQSMDVLFIFLASILFLHEPAENINYLGLLVIVIGIYLVVTEHITKLPRLDRNLLIIAALVPIDVAYALVVKTYLGSTEPIGLAVSIYLMSAVLIAIITVLWRKKMNITLSGVKPQLRPVLASSLFAATSAAFFYTALAQADASKVYPMAGISCVVVFLLASFFLKEKFRWHRLIGTIIVIAGIYLISL